MSDDTLNFGAEDGQKPIKKGKKKAELPPEPDVSHLPGAETIGEAIDLHAPVKKPDTTARAALAMAIAGANDLEIAEQLDYVSPIQARKAWTDALASTAGQEQDHKAMRNFQAARIDAVLKALAPKALSSTKWDTVDGKKVRVANEEHLAYASLYLRGVDRLIRLHGLDAPPILTVVNPTAAQFDQIVDRLATLSMSGEAPEGDIFALEPGEDGSSWGAPTEKDETHD